MLLADRLPRHAVLAGLRDGAAIGGTVPAKLPEFEAFVRSVTPGLLRHARSLCGDAYLAEDLVQEALLRMFLNWARIDMDRRPSAYAYRTVHNLHVSRLERRSSGEVPVDSFKDCGGLVDPVEQVHLRIEVSRILSVLPRRERAVLTARYLRDMSVAETATALGATEPWVRTTSHRALIRLRAIEAAPPAGNREEK
jgi:RNA polymerase sigma-70 factor (sigma-E family)